MPCRSPPERLATVEIDRDAYPPEADDVDQDPLRDFLFALDVDEAEAVGDLPADKEIAPQGLLLGERLVLVDGFDRQIVRYADRVVALLNFAVADEDLPGGRRENPRHHLDQRRLADVVVADKADNLVARNRDIDVAQRIEGAEVFLHSLQTHDRGEVGLRRHHSCFLPAGDASDRLSRAAATFAQLEPLGNEPDIAPRTEAMAVAVGTRG